MASSVPLLYRTGTFRFGHVRSFELKDTCFEIGISPSVAFSEAVRIGFIHRV